MAYEMGLVLQGIYARKDGEVARKLFRNWCAWVHAMQGQTGELLELMAGTARMVEGHLEGILAHWTRGLMTAIHGGAQQPVLGREALSPRVPDGGIHECLALLRRRKTHPTVPLTH
jgi:hypothetical protein